MIRSHRFTAVVAAAFLACQPAEEAAEAPGTESAAESGEMTPAAEPEIPSADQDPVANARSAAPPSIAAGAPVADLQGNVLAEGSGPYTCLPDDPQRPGNAPMCLDEPWLNLISALSSKEEPVIERVGIAYMLQGDAPVSNTDPFATSPTPDNQWVEDSGPHLMVVVPDPAALEGFTTDPTSGGPWVMWAGTPYAHIMIPVGQSQ